MSDEIPPRGAGAPDGPAPAPAHSGRSWLVPLLAALVVLLVVGGIAFAWQQQRPGPGAGRAVAPGAGSAPGNAGSAGPGDAGSAAPGNAGTADPGGAGADVDLGTIAATGYHVDGPRRLSIVYVNGVPDCYGTAGRPRVVETAASVTVTIPRVPAPDADSPGASDRACIDLAVIGSVDVALAAPLGDRTVRDGSRGGAVLPLQSPPDDGT
ncbi:hypothetical protein [Nocardioides mesophilus]|uniref:Uncharacterized protein n=1 Tax=Nocardioides mesophilus TaxID=433659 RepID=A0A7G9RC68_9ACTN|nr:hypothetical protein [Nocardioides mesophilus]QNN53193.1 hypothetical protein H9L09_01490 [Nocardioides mesophilus]